MISRASAAQGSTASSSWGFEVEEAQDAIASAPEGHGK